MFPICSLPLHLLPSQHPTRDGHASTAADTDMSLWFTLGFGIGVLHCGCSQCIMVSVHHYNTMQDNLSARTILCVLPVHPSLSSPSWQPPIDIPPFLPFYLSQNVTAGVVQCVAFQMGLFHSATCFEGASIAFHGLMLILLGRNNIPLPVYFLHSSSGGQSSFPSEHWQL